MENTIEGKVKKGRNRGKALGFPTANIDLEKEVPDGIYLSKTRLEGKTYPSLTFIGGAKTFGEGLSQAESYILDFKEDLYGKVITIKLLEKIRDNQKFNSREELIEQIKNDEKVAKKYFGV